MLKTISKESATRLIEYSAEIRPEGNSWRALYFRFANLIEHYKNDYQVKIAVNLINDLLKDAEGCVFTFPDTDIFVVVKAVPKALLEKVVFQMRYLFMDDPLAYHADGQENPAFSSLYDLSVDWENYIESCRKKLVTGINWAQDEEDIFVTAGDSPPAADDSTPAPRAETTIKPMTPTRLAQVEKDLRHADLSRVIRKQPICAMLPGRQARRVFDEMYINIQHLRQLVMGDVDFISNRYLFKYLTQLLDEKVLELLLSNPNRYFDMPISINLNVATLLSEKFAKFSAAIKPAVKVSIVLELQVSDVFADMEAFILARRTAQKVGYRVCLDGLTTKSFLQVNREGLGFDLAKLQWNADEEADLNFPHNKALAEAVAQCGANRVILCRCDTQSSIEYGHAMGISLFQGRYIDKLLNPDARVEN